MSVTKNFYAICSSEKSYLINGSSGGGGDGDTAWLGLGDREVVGGMVAVMAGDDVMVGGDCGQGASIIVAV